MGYVPAATCPALSRNSLQMGRGALRAAKRGAQRLTQSLVVQMLSDKKIRPDDWLIYCEIAALRLGILTRWNKLLVAGIRQKVMYVRIELGT